MNKRHKRTSREGKVEGRARSNRWPVSGKNRSHRSVKLVELEKFFNRRRRRRCLFPPLLVAATSNDTISRFRARLFETYERVFDFDITPPRTIAIVRVTEGYRNKIYKTKKEGKRKEGKRREEKRNRRGSWALL